MMRPIVAISQRVDVLHDRGERRDALDQRWYAFFEACGLTPLALPNMGADVRLWLDQMRATGIILSGGNDLAALGGDAPERDATEVAAIEWATENKRPLLGVCRGLQLMAHHAGFVLQPITGHVAVKHPLNGPQTGAPSRMVNSYHNWALSSVSGDWRATLTAPDGSVEEMRHVQLPQVGIMWHPERENPFADADISFFKEFFQVR